MNYSFKDIEIGEFFKDEDGIVRQKDSEYKAVDIGGVEWHYFNLKTAQYTIVDQEDLV